MSKETVKIEAPNLIEFVKEIQEKVQQGYTVDDTNEGLPQSWGPGLYTCTLSKTSASVQPKEVKTEVEPKVKSEEISEETPKRRTRKSSK